MKKYKAWKEPYKSRIHGLLPITEIQPAGDKCLAFDIELVYNIAKATGLRSKKKRHINKRFKIVMHQILSEAIERYEEDRTET